MKHSILMAMIATARQSSILYQGKVYTFTKRGYKYKQIVTIFKTLILVGFIAFYSLYGSAYIKEQFGDSILVTIVVVLLVYVLVLGLSYLLGMFLLRNETDMNQLAQRV